MKKRRYIMRAHQIILMGILVGVLFGVFDVFVDVTLFTDETFMETAFSPEPAEIWMRSVVLALFILFSVYITIDMKKRKLVEEALKTSEMHLLSIMENTDDLIMIADKDGLPLVFNDAYKNIVQDVFGVEMKPGLQPHTLLPDKVEHELWEDIHKDVLSGEAKRIEYEVPYKDKIMIFEFSLSPIRIGDTIDGFVEITRDITERKEAEIEIRKSEEKYREFIESTDDLVTQVNNKGNFIMVNHKAKEIFGLGAEECIGKSAISFIHPDDVDKTQRWFDEQIQKKATSGKIENRLVSIDGNVHHMLWTTNIHYDENADVDYINSISSDISELKENEEALHKALDEKDFLIREVNHRIKNNLAILQSLVSMQSSNVNNIATKGYLENIENRIRTLTLIHERLYMSSDVTQVEMKDYVTSLATEIFRSLFKDASALKLELDIDKTMLHVDYVIPCGLIINELLTNALKYAFPVNERGAVSIAFRKEQDGHFRLAVKDTGIGLPDGFAPAKSTGLGMKIVQALVKQLKGTLEYKSQPGAEFYISFRTEQPD